MPDVPLLNRLSTRAPGSQRTTESKTITCPGGTFGSVLLPSLLSSGEEWPVFMSSGCYCPSKQSCQLSSVFCDSVIKGLAPLFPSVRRGLLLRFHTISQQQLAAVFTFCGISCCLQGHFKSGTKSQFNPGYHMSLVLSTLQHCVQIRDVLEKHLQLSIWPNTRKYWHVCVLRGLSQLLLLPSLA